MSSGFTIVELLIVIVVIAILAAITIVAFRGVQNRANDSAVRADIVRAASKLKLADVDLTHYPWNDSEMPDFKVSKDSYDLTLNNVYYCTDKVNNTYALGLRSKSMKGFIATNSVINEGVSVSGAATCAAIGKTWINDATTGVIQGYSSSVGWSSGWKWTQ